MTRLLDSISYPPRGLSREEAARYVGVGVTLFDEMVADGRMPKPKRVNSRVLWDRFALDIAFTDLPGEEDNKIDALFRSRGTATPAEPRAFTPATLAKRWACSERHVRNMIDRGELPSFRFGTLIRVRLDDVQAYEARGR